MKKKIVLLFICTFVLTNAFQDSTRKKENLLDMFKVSELKDASQTMDAVAGDIDNDGDLDIVTANMYAKEGSGFTKILFNDGKGNFTHSKQKLLQKTHGVALGDFDGDNDLDLVITCNSSYQQATRILINNGSGFFEDSGQKLGTQSGLFIQVSDIDCDGDLDLYCDYYNSDNLILLNDGNAKFSLYDKEFTAKDYTSKLVDLNNDNKPDWLIKIPQKGFFIEMNKGEMKFEKTFEINDDETKWGGMTVCDINNDGFKDIINKNSMNNAVLWINDKNGKLVKNQKFGAKSRGAKITTGDLNGDGFEDVFISNNFMPNELYINNKKGNLEKKGIMTGKNELSMRPIISDFNNDKINDIFVSRAIKMENQKRVFLPNLILINRK